MSSSLIGLKQGQQLTMPMARDEENPDLLSGHKLKAIDIKHANRLKFPKGTELDIERLIHRYILSHTGRELKSYPFIRDMKKTFENTL